MGRAPDHSPEPGTEGRARRVFVVAGEASGDLQAAALVSALRSRGGAWSFEGIGGERLRAAGVHTHYDSSGWGTVGFLNSARLIPGLLRVRAQVVRLLERRPPDLLLVVDFGAFNVRLLRHARRLPMRVAYYFPPGSWKRRPASPEMARLTDLVISPFPWSADRLREVGANAHFVGHPLLDTARPRREPDAFRAAVDLEPDAPIVALLPGSRAHEVRCNVPVLAAGCAEIARSLPGVQLVMGLAPSVSPERVAALARAPLEPGDGAAGEVAGRLRFGAARCVLVRGATYDAMAASSLVLSCSGTATLEAAVLERPLVIFYRVSGLSIVEGFLRRKAFPVIGLPNLLAQRRVCPELIQNEFTPSRLADEALDLLTSTERRERMLADLREVKAILGEPGAVDRAADLVMELLSQRGARSVVETSGGDQ